MKAGGNTTEILTVAVPTPPSAPVAVMVYVVAADAAVGVPEITPAALMVKPAGKATLMVAPLSGPSLVTVGDNAVIVRFLV